MSTHGLTEIHSQKDVAKALLAGDVAADAAAAWE